MFTINHLKTDESLHCFLLARSFSDEFPFMPASTAMLNYQPKTMVLI